MWFVEEHLKIASKKRIFKLFVQHFLGDRRWNKGKKIILITQANKKTFL